MVLARWQSTFTDESGNVSAGLSITVREESSGAIASTFSDRDGVASKTSITTDANGYAFFYAAPGRYRIQATGIDWRDVEITQQSDIAQKADLAGGADANFTAMPQVGGDPIVESGSNSDGEWTRWADGTQRVVFNGTANITSGQWSAVGGTNWLHTALPGWTYPIAFSVRPVVYTCADQFVVFRSTANWTGSGFTPNMIRETATDYSPLSYTIFAAGRWK